MKKVIARVKATSDELTGDLLVHAIAPISGQLKEPHFSYSIEPTSRLVKSESMELKEGNVIYDSFGKAWIIVKVLDD